MVVLGEHCSDLAHFRSNTAQSASEQVFKTVCDWAVFYTHAMSLTESHSQRLTEARQGEQMSDALGNREWRGLRQTAEGTLR